MLVALTSVKGSPGVTSTALALAATWPRPVVLLEADPIGGDVTYRCRSAAGGPLQASPSLLTLAAAVRGGTPDRNALGQHAQPLECGVDVVQGVTSGAQAQGLGTLWSTLAQACASAEVDVIADVGRLDRSSAALPLVEAAEQVVAVASTSLEAVMHLKAGLADLLPVLNRERLARVMPLLVGPDAHAAGDCADLDELLATDGLPVLASGHLPYDPRALERLERGETAGGRLGRTLLIRAARTLGEAMTASGVPADGGEVSLR